MPSAERCALAVATAGGLGRWRPAPGTWASLAAALAAAPVLVWAAPAAARLLLAGGAAMALLAGLWAAGIACRHSEVADPPWVVIDEVAGLWTALALLPSPALAAPAAALVLCLLLFRVFDIAKPWPVRWGERLPGALGIMADDLIAGVLAGTLAAACLG